MMIMTLATRHCGFAHPRWVNRDELWCAALSVVRGSPFHLPRVVYFGWGSAECKTGDWWEGATGVCFGVDSHLLYLYIFFIRIFFSSYHLYSSWFSFSYLYDARDRTRSDESEDYIGLALLFSCFCLFVTDVCLLGIDVSSALVTWYVFNPFLFFPCPLHFLHLFTCVGG